MGRVTDNLTYEDGLKSAEDVMQAAGRLDVTQQRNYMAVMSNSMSTEDSPMFLLSEFVIYFKLKLKKA